MLYFMFLRIFSYRFLIELFFLFNIMTRIPRKKRLYQINYTSMDFKMSYLQNNFIQILPHTHAIMNVPNSQV